MKQAQQLQVAETILQQLGGTRRLSVMTGAKNYVALESGVTFKLGRGAKDGITHVTVELDPSDTYTVRFSRVWGTKVTTKSELSDVYCDQLVELFESRTGFYLTF
tara:strand:- start:5038 stop:5352 length:315 start_codon:yes stop_codon:yes gene_type:complete